MWPIPGKENGLDEVLKKARLRGCRALPIGCYDRSFIILSSEGVTQQGFLA